MEGVVEWVRKRREARRCPAQLTMKKMKSKVGGEGQDHSSSLLSAQPAVL